MCDCIKEIPSKIKEAHPEWKGRKVQKVQMANVTFPLDRNKISMITNQELELSLEGRKSVDRVPLAHSFCPFCGEKYQKLKDMEVESKEVKS